MIYNDRKIFTKVWKITPSEKYIDLQVSTSERDSDGTYRNSHWSPRLIGHAFNSLKDKIKVGDRLTITKSKFTNELFTDKEGNKRTFFKFVVLEAEIDEPTPTPTETNADETPASSSEDSPW